MTQSSSVWTSPFAAVVNWSFIILLFVGSSPPVAFAGAGEMCTGAVSVELNTAQDVYRASGSGDRLFQVDVVSPGVLVAEVSDLAPGRLEPRIDLVSEGCEILPTNGLNAPARLVAAVPSPGRFFLRIRPASDRIAGWYRLLAGFSEARPLTVDAPFAHKVDEWDEDDGGDGIADPSFPDKVDEWDEDDGGDGSTEPPGSGLVFGPAAFCGLIESADRDGSATCARGVGLGTSVRAEIGPASATDVDYFTFTLAAHARVVVRSRGETDTYGQLLDAAGRRLAADDDDGPGANFRIAGELCPGRYVVRVEGAAGSEGPYVLEVE